MESGSGSSAQLSTAIVEFLGQKEVLGLGMGMSIGLALGIGLPLLGYLLLQRQYEQQVLRLIADTLTLNKAIVEKNIDQLGKDIEKLPSISTLEPLQSFQPSGAELLLSGFFAGTARYHALWQSLRKIDSLSQQIAALSSEIFEIKRTIKSETRTEVLRVELVPYLRDFNTLTIMRLTELGLECKRASGMLVPKKK